MKKTFIALVAGSGIACGVASTQAASPALSVSPIIDGAVIISLADGSPAACVDATRDRISLSLVRMVSEKTGNFFTADDAIGLVIETMVEGDDGGSVRRVSFPQSFLISVEDYRRGLVALPVQDSLIRRFALSDDDNLYTGVEVTLKLVKVRGATAFSTAIRTLSDLTANLPFPSNPFSDGFEYFSSYATSLIDAFTESAQDNDAQVIDAKLSFQFSETGDCSTLDAKTGSFIIVSQPRTFVEGAMNVEDAGALCYRVENAPTWPNPNSRVMSRQMEA